MNKLFERHPTRETTRLLPETNEVLPKLPDDVTIPDDISGLTHPVTTGVRRPASGIRWMRWLPIAVFLAAGAVTTVVVLRSDTVIQDNVAWTQPTEGPGSNTLAPTGDLVRDVIPWTYPAEGPGSFTLAATGALVRDAIPWTYPTEGPGSNTLAPTGTVTTPIPWTYPTEGPGSNTLTP